jgi:hypothetical protein
MKKLIIILSLIFLLHAIDAKESDTGSTDFRKVNWGMSKAQIKLTETASPIRVEKKEQYLFYKTSIASLDTYLAYYFLKDSLVQAKYLINEEYSNENTYITDFKTLKSQLKLKYGIPDTDDTIWKNDVYKDVPSLWGAAIHLGHLIFSATWETDVTSITIMLDSYDDTIRNQIEYISREYGYLIDEHNKKQTLDDF